MTTVGMLRRLDVPKGEWIIQTAAGSSVGRMVISVAKHKGVSLLTTHLQKWSSRSTNPLNVLSFLHLATLAINASLHTLRPKNHVGICHRSVQRDVKLMR